MNFEHDDDVLMLLNCMKLLWPPFLLVCIYSIDGILFDISNDSLVCCHCIIASISCYCFLPQWLLHLLPSFSNHCHEISSFIVFMHALRSAWMVVRCACPDSTRSTTGRIVVADAHNILGFASHLGVDIQCRQKLAPNLTLSLFLSHPQPPTLNLVVPLSSLSALLFNTLMNCLLHSTSIEFELPVIR